MSYPVGRIAAQGCFTADFGLATDVPVAQVPSVIEEDRAVMAMRPGMRQKHLPVAFDESTATFLSGGRYLFDTFENAVAYREWVANEFVVDGTKFFERPYFIDPIFFAWRVIGAHEFKPIADAHKVIRFERWRASGDSRSALEQAWQGIRHEAQSRDLASVWLVHSDEHQQVGVVSIADSVGQPGGTEPDVPSLAALASMPSLGQGFEDQAGADKIFDRTSWVFTIWFPLREGEPVGRALWPNSPPLPAPIPVGR